MEIGGLQILREDGELAFCRGWRDSADGGRNRVLVLLPASEQTTPTILDRLAHEYSFKDELDSTWAARPLEFSRDRDQVILALEDPGGELLSGMLGTPMELGRFLGLAIAVAAAVGKVHERRLIHKDIKPDNILVNAASGEVRLTGFGIASRLTRERQSIEPPEFIGGTLAYMAPEQTGRMNRSVDSRSDLYGLGVTLYQALTGSLPFTAADPMDWVHCHIARNPAPPSERVKDVPSVVSAIIMKLLAKPAEERYQTAAGLERDLRRCQAEWQDGAAVDTFLLGQQDTPDRLLIPEKLYGRAREVETLLASFDRVVKHGTPELVLISGYSGIGKSSVVNELHRVLAPSRGLFASGKVDQHQREIPYATIAQAFRRLIQSLLGRSEFELSKWRVDFKQALGSDGSLILTLVPELRFIIGEQPAVLDLSPADAKARFQSVFRRFIGMFARPEHPLALFLDDLQWLDVGTLDLIETLLMQPYVGHLLLIGAYRSNEVGPSHPLTRILRSVRLAGASVVEEITLGALDTEYVSRFIADALHCEMDRVADLARLILNKTGGNPLFINQFLSALAEGGLIAFDSVRSRWSWDLKRIHAKGYTDNVADLMIGRIVRLPVAIQHALRDLACLGNIAPAAMLAAIHGVTEQQLHATLIEARREELIDLVESSYRFVHDRVREAAYALIPTDRRAAMHLRIGRTLVEQTPTGKLDDAIFEIVNQLNRASFLMTAPEEREQLAEFNLRAGERAQRSSAYVSALNYLAAGAAMLTEDSWRRRRGLRFALELARAHCEFASGTITEAEGRLRSLSTRAVTTGERVAVACLQVELYQAIDRNGEAVAVGLRTLRHLGVDIPEHPTETDARHAYDGVWARVGARAIEDFVDLPLATDQDALAALDLLIRVAVPGHLFESIYLYAVIVCTAVGLGLERGHTDASCIAYLELGMLSGPLFGQFEAGYRFGRLGCDLVERPELRRYQARTFEAFGFVVAWTRHVRKGREFLFRAFDLASRIGDISFAGYARGQLNTNYLMAGDPLSEAQEQAEHGLAFARKVGVATAEAWILGQLGLIRSLRGLTSRLGSFDDVEFREIDFERDLAGNPALAFPKFWYYIRKLQARFFAGKYVEGLHAASRAQPLLWNFVFVLECVEYHFYSALCHAAVYDCASIEDREYHCARLLEHCGKLDTWALHCPENFANRAALVGAELARIEGRDVDAMRLYELAVRSAREHGFVQNEAVAHEVAARYHGARGFQTSANAHLRGARECYLRWGADGKALQLDLLYPHLAGPELRYSTAAMGSAIRQLDVTSVVNASQALSGEIELPKLIDRLMTIALENAGAVRGVLILPSADEYLIQAEARATGDQIEVTMRKEPITWMTCPESLVRYVIRTRESVILDDASNLNLFSADAYLRDRQSRSILCLPLIKQRELAGILLLENALTSHAFTPARIAVLELLAAQAAISLENTRLYSELGEREAKVRRLVDSNIIGILIGDPDGHVQEANEAFLRIVGYDRADLAAGRLRRTDLTPPEWRDRDARAVAEMRATGTAPPFEKEYLRKDGSRVPVLVGAATLDKRGDSIVLFIVDLTERKRADAELAHANRVATMGQLSASIAHEVNQPLAALLTNAETAVRWLDRQPPNLEKVRPLLDRIIGDSKRAAVIVSRIRDFSKKAAVRKREFEINEAIVEIMLLTRAPISEHRVLVTMQLSDGLPRILGDRVQLQQVILNLIMNAIESLSGVSEGSRELLISTREAESGGVLVAVSDTGPGLPPTEFARIFEAFYTTKASGLGMGLSICRSIVEAHGGQLSAAPNEPRGAVFYVRLPIGNKLPTPQAN
jgi:PAS domain S-box-containing protein